MICSIHSDLTRSVVALRVTTYLTKNPNPPRAQSKMHKFAISGVPAGERVHVKVHSTIDLRRRLQAGFACSATADARGESHDCLTAI